MQGFGQSGDEAFHFLFVGVAVSAHGGIPAGVNIGENVSQQLVVDSASSAIRLLPPDRRIPRPSFVVLVVHRHFGESFELGSSDITMKPSALMPPPGLADNAAERLDLCVRVCVRFFGLGISFYGHDASWAQNTGTLSGPLAGLFCSPVLPFLPSVRGRPVRIQYALAVEYLCTVSMSLGIAFRILSGGLRRASGW